MGNENDVVVVEKGEILRGGKEGLAGGLDMIQDNYFYGLAGRERGEGKKKKEIEQVWQGERQVSGE